MIKLKHTHNILYTRHCRIIPKPLRGKAYTKHPSEDRWIHLGTIKGIIVTTIDGNTFTFGRKYK